MSASDPKAGNEEIRRLQGSINDLISLQALPAIWNGRESGHIVTTLLDVLVSVLRLNFAYARLGNSTNGSPMEFVRFAQRRIPAPQPHEIGRALDRWLTNRSTNAPLTVPNPTDDGDIRILPFPLGLMDEIGVLVAGSKRVDFPTATETLLLRVAANQALVALQEARHLHEQKRAAVELERRVADRTAQLTAANEALRESEKRYRTLFDSIDEGFCTIEVLFDGHDNPIDYRFLEVNPSFEKQTGIQNARGRRMREISPRHEERWFEIYGRIALTGEPVRFEHQAAQLHRWYDAYAFRVGEPADRKVAILFNDITERKQAEAKLRRSEEFLLEAQKLSHTGSWRHVIASGEVTVSPEIYRIHDIKPEDDPSNTEFFFRTFHPEDRKRVVDLFKGAEIEKTEFEVDYRIVLPDGTIKHLHTIGRPVLNESGDLVEFVGTAIDVTAAKRAEEELRRSESNLAEAQRLTHTGSWIWRVAGGEAVHLSEEWYRIYGFDPEEGMPPWEQRLQRVHPEDRDAWQRTIDRAIHAKSDYQMEFRIVLPDGAVKYVHTVGHPVLNASGDLEEFVGSATDITGRKRAEMLLGGEKRLLEMIARGDSRALILDALCRLVEELATGALTSILLLDPKTDQLRHGAAPSLPTKYTEAIDGAVIGPCVGSCGTAAYRAEPVIVSDIASDPLWADFRDLALGHRLRACWSTPILSSASNVLGTFAIYYREPRSPTPQEHDLIEQITHLASIALEREQAEEALRQAQADLAHVSRVTTMGELTASIAHEVNQPLTAVVNNANACLELLPHGPADLQEVREALTEIVDDTNRASAVITRVRQLAKKAPFERTRLHLKDVIADVLALARYECATRQTTIRPELAEDLPLVLGDRVQLQQVLLNLVVNGMDAMNGVEESNRVLIIRGRRESRDGIQETRLSVQDAGAGFKPGEMERLFETFYTTKAHGMGMGLAISRSIIEAHGGRLWAEPNQGAGATFLISLPAAPESLVENGLSSPKS